MSVKGVRVVLVHEPKDKPEAWISLLTELSDGTEPLLLAAADADEEAIRALNPHRLVVVAPLDKDIYPALMESIPILAGVQALESFVAAFGGRCESVSVQPDHYLMHDAVGIWTGFSEPLEMGSYPEFALVQTELPAELVVTAWNDDRVALALSHRLMPLVALNFYPTDLGDQLGRNLLLAFLEGRYLTGTPMGPPDI